VFQTGLERLRSDSRLLPHLKDHYREHPIDFIADWGYTFDPRNPEIGLPAKIPFVPFPRQVDWAEYSLKHWLTRRRALTEKSRDSGVTWLAVALSCALCLFREGLVVGFGSRVEDYVDKLGDPKSIFEKARIFIRALPSEFLGDWREGKHSFHMRLMFPSTGSLMIGEGGDNIGRGNRNLALFRRRGCTSRAPVDGRGITQQYDQLPARHLDPKGTGESVRAEQTLR
jgi:hypothetical protein